MTRLHTLSIGDEGPKVAFCHGVFGQGRNWQTIAKALVSPDHPPHQSILIDLPNHGRSPWTDSLTYPDLADEVARFLEPHAPLAIVGHSMGGKAMMNLALRHPDLVERLVVVDISPVHYRGPREFNHLVHAMLSLDLTDLPNRRTAEERMAEEVPNPSVRAFLLQNLHRSSHARHLAPQWEWQANLQLIASNLDVLADWEDPVTEPFGGQVLWIGGANSDYVLPEYEPHMRELFPRVRQVMVKNSGHWVHSEQPEVFVSVLRQFLDQPPARPAARP